MTCFDSRAADGTVFFGATIVAFSRNFMLFFTRSKKRNNMANETLGFTDYPMPRPNSSAWFSISQRLNRLEIVCEACWYYTSFWHHLPICFLKDMCRYTEGLCVPQLLACKKSICSANVCNEAALTKKNFIEASTRNIPSIIFLKQVHYEYVCVIARKNAVHNTLYGTFLKQNMPYTNKCLVYSMGQKKNDAIIASDSAPPMLVVALLATWCRDYNRM